MKTNCRVLSVLLGSVHLVFAQPPPRVDVIADLLEAFRPAQAQDTLECAVRRPASAGGVKENGLFEHPLTAAKSARVEYDIDLPAAGSGERLLLAFDIALSDGIQLGSGEDGVRFRVEVDGRELFAQVCHECRWSSYAVDLSAFSGRRGRLALLVDGLRNTSYDWALWGNPRVLFFERGSILTKESVPVTMGSLAVHRPSGRGLRIQLKPVGGGDAIDWPLPAASTGAGTNEWFVKEFSFHSAKGVGVTWEPADALTADSVWVGAFPPQLKLRQLSVARAVPVAGEPVRLCVEITNEGRGPSGAGDGELRVQVGNDVLRPRAVPPLSPGETWQEDRQWMAPTSAGHWAVKAGLETSGDGRVVEKTLAFETFPPMRRGSVQAIESERLRIEFVRVSDGYAYARIFGRQNDRWTCVGVWRPFFRVISETRRGERDWEIRPQRLRKLASRHAPAVELTARLTDADDVAWTGLLRITLEPDQPVARVHYEWQAAEAREVRALWGPNLYVGDGTTGAGKTWGLFPGLEYLYGAEPSSNPRDFSPSLAGRRTPDATKITVPLMAVTIGSDSRSPSPNPGRFFAPDSLKDRVDGQPAFSVPGSDLTVALLWDPHQKWDGEHAFPSARFSSPNLDEGMENHRLGLFLPSTPEFVAENGDRARTPYRLEANHPVTLDARLAVTGGPVLSAMREWYREGGGLPRPERWPRSFEEELAVCRAGFLRTVWDEKSQGWRHCVGWAPAQAPGFATLLWWDAHVTRDAGGARASSERVELAAKHMLGSGGPASFMSPANCHILRWEFPFYFGGLPEALDGLAGQIQALMRSQQADGGWVYEPANAQQAELGQPGDSVLGTCAARASALARYARITGDRTALEAAEKALRLMENFRVPRGGQTWECPMYEPDILAAAYAIAAYTDAFEATGDPRWLHDAVYWAETGVPFIYQWALPDRPMMLGATIPVFGSTFYTHTWLAVPVQWCGLVYAYHVFHLAEMLERTKLAAAAGSPLPLALGFSPADWRRVVELITISGMYQQFADGDKIGAYPDSLSRFEHRNPAFINPEDILANVLLLEGHDPDIKTARLQRGGAEIVISSGARVTDEVSTSRGARFRLRFFKNESSHSLVVGLLPREVRVNGQTLTRSEHPRLREPGWWWDTKQRRLYLTVPHDQETVEMEVITGE